MKIAAIIQARMGSTRLPGKVLMPIGDRSMLSYVAHRVQKAKLVDVVLVATSENQLDDRLVDECVKLGVAVFRGSEDDVLDRFYKAAHSINAEVIVRITADCPLIDPELIDEVVRSLLDSGADYASNTLIRHYPRGLDVEAFTIETLDRAWEDVEERFQRTHVTPYIYQNHNLFNLKAVRVQQDLSDHRWTVDTIEDLELIRAIYKYFRWNPNITWLEVLEFVEDQPTLQKINSNVKQKPLHQG